MISLNRWETGAKVEPVSGAGYEGLRFPVMTMEEAREYAGAFLDKVLSGNEKVTFTENEQESLSAQSYSFQGNVELNGLPSPMTVSVRVRLSDGAVTRFWRGDESDYAGAPGEAKTSTTDAAARELLKDTLSLRLEYVLDWDGEEGTEKKAVLRYLPNSTDEFYVDAATGELVNLTELREQLEKGGSGAANRFNVSAAPEAAADTALSKAELEAACRKCIHAEVTDTKVLAHILHTANVDHKILSATSAEIYAKVNISKLAAELAKENCEIFSMQEKDEDLESYFFSLVGGSSYE